VSHPFADLLAPLLAAATSPQGIGLLVTAGLLGVRHGIDWDHIAAITDITSTTATADAGTAIHGEQHRILAELAEGHRHEHGGPSELHAHDRGPGAATLAAGTLAAGAATAGNMTAAVAVPLQTRARLLQENRHAILLGTLYALGHASVVAVLGLAALVFGAVLPDWVDPILSRVVGLTLVVLGIWVFVSLYQYFRHGTEFRLRSRWMLVFDSVRYSWRRVQAKLHGHAHVEPLEMSSYGARTAFGVGMIHGIGAETGTQVLIIAAVGGAAGVGLGIPMMIAFIVGLLISNTIVVVISSTGFVASQTRQRIYLAFGVAAGAFSLVVGLLFLFELEGLLPDLDRIFGFIGS
jgi:high-affinity nickel-transport protein